MKLLINKNVIDKFYTLIIKQKAINKFKDIIN